MSPRFVSFLALLVVVGIVVVNTARAKASSRIRGIHHSSTLEAKRSSKVCEIGKENFTFYDDEDAEVYYGIEIRFDRKHVTFVSLFATMPEVTAGLFIRGLNRTRFGFRVKNVTMTSFVMEVWRRNDTFLFHVPGYWRACSC